IVPIISEESGENLQPVFHSARHLLGGTEKLIHLLTPLGVFVREVHSGKSDVTSCKIVCGPCRVVNRRLSGEGQHRNAVVAKPRLILGNEAYIAGEDEIA